MQLRTLAGLERKKIEDELAALVKLIEKLESILADEKKILKIIKDELLDMKKQFGDERRTKVVPQELGRLSDEDLVPDEQVVVTLTSANYIKRTSIVTIQAPRPGRQGPPRHGYPGRRCY
jgi:DNA gyrase subunit A